MVPSKTLKVVTFALVIGIAAIALVACGSDSADAEKNDSSDGQYTVGTLNFVPPLESAIEGFKLGMSELGYVEGKNVTYISQGADDPEQYTDAAQVLVDADVDLILVSGTLEAQTVQAITGDIPIVFTISTDPLGAGIIDTLELPGRNTTGIIMTEFDQRRLQLLLEIDPSIQQIYVPYNPADVGPARMIGTIQNIAPELGIEIIAREVPDFGSLPQSLEDIPEEADAIFLGPDDIVLSALPDWIQVSMEKQLPLSIPATSPIPQVLMGYGPNPFTNGKQAARLADQVLKGTDAGSLPIENTEFSLTISLPAANALGIEISDALLEQADTILRSEKSE